MTHVKTAVIIGGGIAGAVAAMALQKAGIAATIYEAYAAPADGIGGMLMVAPNGLNALAIIGVDAAVGSIGQPIERTVIAAGDGRRLFEFGGIPGLPPSRLLWRSDLYRVLNDAARGCGIAIKYGKRLTGVEDAADGVTAQFADGSSASADVLIGADGINSTVRTLIDPDAPGAAWDGLLGFGAASSVTVPGRTDTVHFVFGRRAFLGYWLQPDGRTAWFSNLPRKEFMSRAAVRAIPAVDWLRELREVYAGDVPADTLLKGTSPDDLLVLGPTDMLPPVPHWSRGRMVLVGDSAHAPNHSSGQGVSLAAESAIEIARCLRDLPDIPSAFAAYERLRRPRVERIAAEAAKTNQRKGAGPVAAALMNLIMPLATKAFMRPEKMFGWVQGYRIDWDAAAKADLSASLSAPRGEERVAGTFESPRQAG